MILSHFRTKYSMKKIYCLFIAALLITFCQAQKEKLELNLAKGETYTLNISSKSTMDMTKNGKQLKLKDDSFVILKFKVTDIQDSIYNMVATIDSIYFNGNVFNMAMGFFPNRDGKVPNDNENLFFKRFIAAVKGIPILIKMTKRGKLSEVEKILVDSSRIQVISNLFVQGVLKMIPEIYPVSNVAIGGKWTILSPLPSSVFTTTGATFELKEVTNNYMLISGYSVLKINDNVIAQKGKSAVKSDLTNTMSSNIKVDKKTGWIIDAKISQIIKGTVKADPKKEGDKDYPININTETIITDK